MFLDLITQNETILIQSYYQQLYDKKKDDAAAQFDANLKEEVITQLRKLNITFETEELFDAFAAAELTKITITDTNTSMICKDVVVNAGNVTNFGIILAEWKGDGYEIKITPPFTKVTTFEK